LVLLFKKYRIPFLWLKIKIKSILVVVYFLLVHLNFSFLHQLFVQQKEEGSNKLYKSPI